jgi:hypothetical protein
MTKAEIVVNIDVGTCKKFTLSNDEAKELYDQLDKIYGTRFELKQPIDWTYSWKNPYYTPGHWTSGASIHIPNGTTPPPTY